MDMSGEYVILAPRQAVWEALNDPNILKQCIPGCDSISKISNTEFEAKVTSKIGPVRAKFAGKVTLSEIDPPNGYTISGEGSGGAAGFAKGGAKISLSDEPEGTKLSYLVEATVGGKLAQIGSRLIDSTAKKMANDFFSKFAEVVTNGPETFIQDATETKSPANSAKTVTADEHQSYSANVRGMGLSPAAWIIGLIAALLVIVFLFQGK